MIADCFFLVAVCGNTVERKKSGCNVSDDDIKSSCLHCPLKMTTNQQWRHGRTQRQHGRMQWHNGGASEGGKRRGGLGQVVGSTMKPIRSTLMVG